MPFLLKKMPEEMTDYIELPDMAELLTMPIFFDCPIEEALKYGSDFQKKLLSMVPLRGTKKYTTILSEVRMLTPVNRSCTGFSDMSHTDSDYEWHIDTEEELDGSMKNYGEETDIVHLLVSKTSCMTEFLKSDIMLNDINPSEHSLYQMLDYIRYNKEIINLEPVKIPHNRIVTFTNHLHRATKGDRIEFRYMFRVVETDRKRPPSNPTYNPNHTTTIIDTNGEQIENISQKEDKIILHLPPFIRDNPSYRPGENKVRLNKSQLVVENMFFEKLDDESVNAILEVKDFDIKEIDKFAEVSCKNVKILEKYDTGNYFNLEFKLLNYNSEKAIFVVFIDKDNAKYLKDVEYTFTVDNSRFVRLDNSNNISAKYRSF